MSKDLGLLLGISKFFTEDTLNEILRKSTGENNATVTGWSFKPSMNRGDGYMSQINRITVHGEVGGKGTEVQLVVKSLPKNIGRRKTFRSVDFFHNEVMFYKEVVPVFEKFIESKGQRRLLCIPTCFSSMSDGENDYIALQDVSVHGYGPVSRLNCLDLEQMNLLLKAMADFHAISFAYKDQNTDKFQQLADKLVETYFGEEFWYCYKNYRAILIRVAKDALDKEYPGHPSGVIFDGEEPAKKLWDKSSNFCNRSHAPTSVINQGDSWAPNFLARNIGDGSEKQGLLLDFQLARVASPVLDLSFLVYACSDKKLLDEHFDEMLKTYHSTLANGIKSLGSDPEHVYPWFLFEEEVKEQWIHGLNFAIEAVPFSMMEESEVFDLDVLIKGEVTVDMGKVLQVQNIKTSAGRRRLADLIVHAHSRHFF